MILCELCDLPEETCVHGRGIAVDEPVRSTASHRFQARYNGQCNQPGCWESIREGDLIRYIDDLISCGRCS